MTLSSTLDFDNDTLTKKKYRKAALSPREINEKFVNGAFDAINKHVKPQVTCVQVGACDGKRWDPIYNQVTTNGWQSFPLEPHPVHFESLCRNYASFDQVKPIRTAISDEPGEMFLFHVSKESIGKFPRWLQGCSSLRVQRMNESVATAAKAMGTSVGLGDITGTLVPMVTLDDLLSSEGVEKLDVLVIDTEGHEIQVLSSLTDARFSPQLAIVECNGIDTKREQDYVDQLARFDLRVWRVRDDLWGLSEALTSSEVFDEIRESLSASELLPSSPEQDASGLTERAPARPAAAEPVSTSDTKVLEPVPKKLGHVWIGYKRPPLAWMETWPQMHPDWSYQIYDNDYLTGRSWKNEHLIAGYVLRNRFEGAADLMRYEILYEQGGFIAEADSTCLQNVDALLKQPSLYTVYEHERRAPGFVSPFLASSPGHPFLKTIIDHLYEKQSVKRLKGPFKSVGNQFLSEMIAQHKPEISIFPSYFFLPRHFAGRHYNGDGPIFADQHWGSTTRAYPDYTLDLTVKHSKELFDWAHAVLDRQ